MRYSHNNFPRKKQLTLGKLHTFTGHWFFLWGTYFRYTNLNASSQAHTQQTLADFLPGLTPHPSYGVNSFEPCYKNFRHQLAHVRSLTGKLTLQGFTSLAGQKLESSKKGTHKFLTRKGLLCRCMGTKREFLEQGPGRGVQSFGFSGPGCYLQSPHSRQAQSNNRETRKKTHHILSNFLCIESHLQLS